MGKFSHVVPLNGNSQVSDVGEYKEKADNQNSLKLFSGRLNSSVISTMLNLESDFTSEIDLACSGRPGDWEERLSILLDAIDTQESDEVNTTNTNREESFEKYLHDIVETQMITGKLETYYKDKEYLQKNELVYRARAVLQTAMSKLEEELIERLLQHGQHDEADRVSFSVSEEDLNDLSKSFGGPLFQGRSKNDDKVSEILPIDLVSSEALSGTKDIVAAMFMSKYVIECCQSYISVRKDYLDGRLSFLRIEKLSIEDILEMDLTAFTLVVRRWNHALKMFVQVYLASEKCLCERIFGDFSESASEFCFLETGKSSMLQLLNFAQAVAVSTPSVENLFRVLDMYEVLSDLLPDIKSFFPEDCGCDLMAECLEILSGLKSFVKKTFTVFKELIRTKTSHTPFARGGIHPLTKYVMNYISVLSDYQETLDSILDGKDLGVTPTDANDIYSSPTSTLTQNLQSVTSILESNLTDKSMLYQDASLQHFFMMNNICYMVKKARNPVLSLLLGNNWLLDHIRSYKIHARNYERASWGIALSFLKYEGICNGHGNSPSTRIVKDRFTQFNGVFEDIYRTQTSWLIADDDLREDLRISIGQNVLQAYRMFHGRYAGFLDNTRHKERYIKYSPDDLMKYLLDLFEGSQKCP